MFSSSSFRRLTAQCQPLQQELSKQLQRHQVAATSNTSSIKSSAWFTAASSPSTIASKAQYTTATTRRFAARPLIGLRSSPLGVSSSGYHSLHHHNPSIPLQQLTKSPRISTAISLQPSIARSFHSSPVTMGVHNLANKADFTSALSEHKIVVLDAFATWCGPCKIIAPKVVEYSEKYTDVYFTKLDVDEVPDVAQELGIRAMPTFIIFKDGEKLESVVGINPKALVEGIEKAIAA